MADTLPLTVTWMHVPPQDVATDMLIQQTLDDFAHSKCSKGRVALVIAHKIETVLSCDHLLVRVGTDPEALSGTNRVWGSG